MKEKIDFLKELEELRNEFEKDIKGKEVEKIDFLEKLKIKYLGRKSKLNTILKFLKNLSLEEKKIVGQEANSLRKYFESYLKEKIDKAKYLNISHLNIDYTKPPKKIQKGHYHPLTLIKREIIDIFKSLNFSIVDGPEIENEYYNFEALNILENHPARDLWDTFWLKDEKLKINNKEYKMLLRTHTSPVQIRYMLENNPPFQIIVPGRVFRYEATDASHEINFYQVEGLMVSENVNLANFKFIIETFLKKFFKKEIEFRYRPSYFPFVEPGLEVDIKFKDSNKWLEIMGAGMVHRKVFEAVKYNPDNIQGFAFGMGLDRLAMLKYNIPDIRLFYENDLRFLKQF